MNASTEGQNGGRRVAVQITMVTNLLGPVSMRHPQGSPMQKNVLIALGFLILAVFAFVGYNSFSARRHESSDEVYSSGNPIPGPAAARPPAGPSQPPSTPPTPAGNIPLPSATPEVTAGGVRSTPGLAPPAADSLAPDPPNGVKFGGNGHFQLYRQGDLTWRLNTDTGETCVLFATDGEWHKPKVYKAGCRNQS